jgi:proteic killer suppression protein
MAITFLGRGTEDVYNGIDTKAARKVCPSRLIRRARAKLFLIDDAESVRDLKIPPGNRLEELKGDRRGQHSIRINDQFRICFRWTDAGARDVEIVDYHF